VSIFKSIDSNYCVAVRDPMYISQITTAPKPEKIIYYKVLTRDRSDHFSNISYSCGHGLARKISAKRRYLATFSSPCLHAYRRIDCSDSCLEPFSHVTLNCDPRATTLVFEQDLHARIQGGAHRARPPPFSLEGIFLTLIIFAQGSK